MSAALLRALAAGKRAEADEYIRQAEATEAAHREWTDQTASPLGRRRHIAACRARVAQGDPRAAHVGRRWLLSCDAVAAELAALSQRPARKAKPALAVVAPTSMADRLTAAQRGGR